MPEFRSEPLSPEIASRLPTNWDEIIIGCPHCRHTPKGIVVCQFHTGWAYGWADCVKVGEILRNMSN